VTNSIGEYPLGSEKRPLRVAVVGAGPSGFYAVDALLRRKEVLIEVDTFDRLPVPYGLVRFGVAPDHQNIKAIIKGYEKTATNPRFRFFGNIQFGRDIHLEDLQAHYDQIIYAVGAETDRKLDIPGEMFSGSYTATEFVAWYNGHPDYVDSQFDLSHERTVVVGIGNVAMDVTRILAKSADELATTDIADYALESLRASKIREIVILGRRGAAQAAFTPKEIKEIGSLEDVDLLVDSADLVLDAESKKSLETDKQARANVEYLTEKAREGQGASPKKVHLRLLRSPVEIIGENGHVIGVRIERNVLTKSESGDMRPRGSGEFETIPCGTIFRSVGYHGIPLPGVPFDKANGVIPNERGRVVDLETGDVVRGQYVVGWIKRGPTGLLGTNKGDSSETVDAMLEDIQGQTAPIHSNQEPGSIESLLRSNNAAYLTFSDWKELDHLEIEKGAALGKIRQKFVHLSDMLEALNKGSGQ
jgi:ferredoxin--NADP+ reductase